MSRIIQFIWVQPQKAGVYRCSSHASVADITDDEWRVAEDVTAWLTKHRPEIQVSFEETKATGGDHTDLAATLGVLADYYNYSQMPEDNETLAEHGILRNALTT